MRRETKQVRKLRQQLWTEQEKVRQLRKLLAAAPLREIRKQGSQIMEDSMKLNPQPSKRLLSEGETISRQVRHTQADRKGENHDETS